MVELPTPSEDFEDLYENAPCGYMSMLPDRRIFKANATLLGWTGYSAEQLLGKHFHEVLSITSRIFYETHIAPLLHMQGFFNEVTLDFTTAAGANLPITGNAREIRGENGDVVCVRLAMFKAVERRRYEREIVAAQDAAMLQLNAEQQTAKLRDQFIAVLGHDLRNPLASISAAARILGREEQSERATKALALMQSSVSRMNGIITNVLDFARGRLGGGIALNRSRDPLEPVLHQVVEELRVSFPDRKIETDFQLTWPVATDCSRMGQLASNLLSNALTHGAEDLPVRIHASTKDGQLTLWVANGGNPIPESVANSLFEPFFRGDVRPTQQGLGLGLHIASEIAKAHGGVLTVRSSAQETRFTFTMPAGQERS